MSSKRNLDKRTIIAFYPSSKSISEFVIERSKKKEVLIASNDLDVNSANEVESKVEEVAGITITYKKLSQSAKDVICEELNQENKTSQKMDVQPCAQSQEEFRRQRLSDEDITLIALAVKQNTEKVVENAYLDFIRIKKIDDEQVKKEVKSSFVRKDKASQISRVKLTNKEKSRVIAGQSINKEQLTYKVIDTALELVKLFIFNYKK